MSTFCKGNKEDSVVGKAKQINAKMEHYFFFTDYVTYLQGWEFVHRFFEQIAHFCEGKSDSL